MEFTNIINTTFNLIESGRLGKNIGLTSGLDKLDSVTGGNQKGVYSLIFGGTGSGKSSLAIYANMYKPMMSMFGNPQLKFVLYSLEMSAEVILTKLLSLYIYDTFDEELSYKQILSKREILSDKNYELVNKCKDWLNTVLQKHLIIYDKRLNADILYASLSSILDKLGTTVETEHQKIYTFNDPNQQLYVFIDHISLLRKSGGRSKKEEIDLASNYLVTLRNRCKISPIVIMQSNRTGMSMDRRNAGMAEPQLEDIKDSGGPSEDAEIVLAVFYPHREKMTTYRGYKIQKCLEDKFRSIVCLKNRFGECDIAIGCNFFGSIGLFRELPKSEEIGDYSKYLNLKNEYEEINIPQIDENRDENTNTFKF
jgi:replicative DNA helicase